MPNIHSHLAVNVLCVVMRQPRDRMIDIVHPRCHFFDVDGAKAEWAGNTIQLPCAEYSNVCYTKKLAILVEKMLETNNDFFYYVENDNYLCVSTKTIQLLAQRYMVDTPYELITTGVGASGWLFSRKWATAFLEALQTCSKWCYCPDCIAALLPLPRATTRVLLNQHSTTFRVGLNKNTKFLPRCFQKRVESGLNNFDFFDHKNCKKKDITPCTERNWDIFFGH